jgi:hypothetical protein
VRRIVCICGALAAGALGVGLAQGEVVQKANLRLTFTAGFAPQALPREREAPVSVRVGGSIGTATGARPPAVRRISFAVNRYGHVFTRGLPSCSGARLEGTSPQQAMEACPGARVGSGYFLATVNPPNGRPFTARGNVIAFNARAGDRPALLLHVYAPTPAKITVILNFAITHPSRGRFGTVFTTRIPTVAANLGYVTKMALHFDRRFRYGGRIHGYFSARCAAPRGFKAAIFTFARGRFFFDNGQQLTTPLTRSCRVR